MDLTPRPVEETARPRATRRRYGGAVVLALVLVGAGLVLWQGLSNATLYFCNADEVGVRDACRGDGRFRLQGTVVDGTVRDGAGRVDFDVTYGGVTIPVRHAGDPPQLFQPGIPVVVEGRYDGSTFQSDRILVKHTEEYREANPDRVADDAP